MMLSPYVNSLTPILRLTLEALFEQGELAEPQRAILVADVAGKLDHFFLIFPEDEERALVAQGRQEFNELLRACREGDAVESATYALAVVRTLGMLEELRVDQSLSENFRLENLLFLLMARLRGASCDGELKAAARTVRKSEGEWHKIQSGFTSELSESDISQNKIGFDSVMSGAETLQTGELSRARLELAYQHLAEGAEVLDEMFSWHHERCEEADKIPVVGRKFYTLRKQSASGREMTEEELIQWLDNYLPAFENWWDKHRGELLLSRDNLQVLEQRVEALYDQAEEKLMEPSERLDYIDSWFELFEFAEEESLATEEALQKPWGSFLLTILQDGIPIYLVEHTETQLRESQSEVHAILADALTDYLDTSDRTPLLHLLEELQDDDFVDVEDQELFF